MAHLYLRELRLLTLGCYSERGLMSYFMFRVLPARLPEFLRQVSFPDGFPHAFQDLGRLEEVVLFSELDFGNRGFGKPDGALFFRSGDRRVFVFIEVKLNQSYERSCNAGGGYNSSIKGQLELKWRARIADEIDVQPPGFGGRYIVENEPVINFYQANDPIYAGVLDIAHVGLDARRRLRLVEGVGAVFDNYIRPCGTENVYYLAVTHDNANPLDRHPDLQPQCCDGDGHEVNGLGHFCWINKALLEQWLENAVP